MELLAEGGLWTVSATAREGQSLEVVERLLLGVVDKLKRGAFTDAELAAVVLNAEIDDERALEDSDERVARMIESFAERVPWPDEASRLARMRKVTRDDVVRVSNRYLGASYVAVKRVRGRFEPPRIDKPAITPIALDTARESPLAREVKAMPVVPLEPVWLAEGTDYQRISLAAGPLVASRNRRHDLFTVSWEWQLGSRRMRLLCHALDLLDSSGAKGLSAIELKRRLYAMGTSVSSTCSTDRTELRASGIDRNMQASVALVERWLRTVEIDPKIARALAANRVSQRNDEMQDPQEIARALGEYVDLGVDSSYLTVPSNRELLGARPRDLAALLGQLPDLEHRTGYFGPRDGADAARLVALGRNHRRVPPPPPVRYRKASGTRIFLVSRKVAQSQIGIAMPGRPIATETRPVAELYSEYMGGNMGSVVYQEIRESRGLAYSASAGFAPGARRGDETALVGTLGTQSDKTVEALTTMLALLRRMPKNDNRFRIARDALDEQYRSTRASPRAVPDWVFAWDDLGERADPRPRGWAALRRLAPGDLAGFADRSGAAPTLISILGNRERFDRAALEKIGRIEKVRVSALFGY
jgi:hypothetical protein